MDTEWRAAPIFSTDFRCKPSFGFRRIVFQYLPKIATPTSRLSVLFVQISVARIDSAAPTQAWVRLHWTDWRSDLSSVNCRRSCLSCCWSKGVEWPAKRRYVGLVAVGVQEQAEDILVPPLLRNCLTLNDISFSWSLSPLQNSGPFYWLGHFRNVYDVDDDDDSVPCYCVRTCNFEFNVYVELSKNRE